MIVSVVFIVFFLAFVHFIHCSTIITRGMIRTPSESNTQSKDQLAQMVLPDPEKLMSATDVHKKYHRIYPSFMEEEERTKFKNESEEGNQEVSKNVSRSETSFAFDNNASQAKQPNLNSSKIVTTYGNHTSDDINENMKKLSENTTEGAKYFNAQVESSSTVSPQEISKRYWEHYNNLSSDVFQNSYQQNSKADSVEKGFSDSSFGEILQRFYTCTWTTGLMPCLQETLRVVSSELSFVEFLSPRLPRFELQGRMVEENLKDGDIVQQVTDQDNEGRKRTKRLRVFQALQFLIPLLLAIKMSMLPALAVMVLVTGKAFFMSVLSLGAAIFSFVLQTPALSANKRVETASQQMPLPHDRDPSKFYYVM